MCSFFLNPSVSPPVVPVDNELDLNLTDASLEPEAREGASAVGEMSTAEGPDRDLTSASASASAAGDSRVEYGGRKKGFLRVNVASFSYSEVYEGRGERGEEGGGD